MGVITVPYWNPCARRGFFGECWGQMGTRTITVPDAPVPLIPRPAAPSVSASLDDAPAAPAATGTSITDLQSQISTLQGQLSAATTAATLDRNRTIGEQKTDLLMNLNTMRAVAHNYREINASTATLQADKARIEAQIQVLRAASGDFETAAETYEKEFLDRKSSLPTHNILQTLQDYIMALFFLGFIFFSIIIILTYNTTYAMIGVSLVSIILGVGTMEAIRKFG